MLVDLALGVQTSTGVVEVDVAGGVQPRVLGAPELGEAPVRIEVREARRERQLRCGQPVELVGSELGRWAHHRRRHRRTVSRSR